MQNASSQRLVITVSIVAAVAGLLFGFDTGVISGALLYIKPEFHLTTSAEGIVVGAVLLGALFGSALGGKLADLLGRRKVLMLTALVFVIGTMMTALAPSVNTIIIGRIIIGLGIGLGSYCAPLYIAEAAPVKHRGALVTFNQLAITIGILVAFLANYLFSSTAEWRWMFGVGVFPAIALWIGALFVPESPRWLVMKGFTTRAKRIIEQLDSDKSAEEEIAEIQQSLKKPITKLSVLFQKPFRAVLLVGIGLAFLQQISGINTIIYYAPSIFKLSGFHSNSSSILATLSVGFVNVFFTILSIKVVDKIGRRPLLLIGCIGMAISLAGLSIAFHSQVASLRWVALGSLFIYIACFAFSLGAMMWLLFSEMFPLQVRGEAMGIAVAANWFSNMIVSAGFPDFLHMAGPTNTFLTFAIVCVLGWFFCYYFIPETKGVSLEAIEANVRDGAPVRDIGQPVSKKALDVAAIN